MTFLGATAVLIATHQSHGRWGFLAVLLPLAALEPLLIVAFHQSLIRVVQVVDISMALPALGLASWYLIQDRAGRLAITFMPATAAPQVQVSR
jgi:hypothetical protein